jgi:hypothetical protein
MDAERKELLERLQSGRTALQEVLQGVDEMLANRKPAAGPSSSASSI